MVYINQGTRVLESWRIDCDKNRMHLILIIMTGDDINATCVTMFCIHIDNSCNNTKLFSTSTRAPKDFKYEGEVGKWSLYLGFTYTAIHILWELGLENNFNSRTKDDPSYALSEVTMK